MMPLLCPCLPFCSPSERPKLVGSAILFPFCSPFFVPLLGSSIHTASLPLSVNSTLPHPQRLIEEAQSREAPVQRLVDKASKNIVDAKFAKDFQTVLKEFQKARRLAAERKTAYTPFVSQAALSVRRVDESL
ncbi:Syntaxin [Arachis hypogaea]|nr:Syntaxin [Arachis hypogaea]